MECTTHVNIRSPTKGMKGKIAGSKRAELNRRECCLQDSAPCHARLLGKNRVALMRLRCCCRCVTHPVASGEKKKDDF